MNVILSIKPRFADAIFSGKKKVEFRKSLLKKKVDHVLVYSSSPVQKFIGYFTISHIVENSPHQLWQQFGDQGCIAEDEFFRYFQEKKKGYSICISTVNKFGESIFPHQLIDNFTPPQSFHYYNGDLTRFT